MTVHLLNPLCSIWWSKSSRYNKQTTRLYWSALAQCLRVVRQPINFLVVNTARKVSNLGITTHIASINHDSILTRLINQEPLGTTILPQSKKSNVKRWIAYHSEKNTGTIYINRCLFEVIQENKRIMILLPVGIEKYSGHFKRGDLIDICAPDGHKIGVGIAKYDAHKLNEYAGQKGKPALIHYDYLHIF